MASVISRQAWHQRVRGISRSHTRLSVPVAPPRAPYFSLLVQRKVSKRNTPLHPGLALLDSLHAGIVPRVVTTGPPWPIVPHSTSMSRAPLHNTSVQPPDGAFARLQQSAQRSDQTKRQLVACLFIGIEAGTTPVSRVNGVDVQEVARQGCRASCDGPRKALRSVPLEHRWTTAWMQEVGRRRMPKPSERTRNAAQRSEGPNVGCPFSLVTFLLGKQQESNSPAKAKPTQQVTAKAAGKKLSVPHNPSFAKDAKHRSTNGPATHHLAPR